MADETDDGLEEGSGAKASVGDIFGVSAGKKKKKKKPKSEIVTAEEIGRDDEVPFMDDDQDAPDAEATLDAEVLAVDEQLPRKSAASDAKPKKAKKPKSAAALDGVLRPSADAPPRSAVSDDYLSPADLGDYDAPKSKAVPMLIGVIVLLVLVIIGGGVVMTGQGDDLIALFKGELKEKRIAEARMIEDQHKADQLEKLERFGNLMISGNPQYALVKLNGQMQFGETSQGWREIRVGTSPGVQDLKIRQAHQVEFSAPGFEPTTIEVTEGRWQEAGGGAGYSYAISPSLLPVSVHAKQEFDARLGQDTDNEFYGTMTINTMPSGAKVMFNNQPLLDEKGEERVTPVTFDTYWVKDEKTGKLEEKRVRVDTTLDVGHKVQAFIEYESTCPESSTPIACGKVDNCCPEQCNVATDADCKWPKYVTSLTRPMWTCTWNTKDGQPPSDIPKGKTIQHFCDYSFGLDVDFNGLKTYIVAAEEERQRILKQIKDAQSDDAPEAAPGGETAAAAE